MSKFMHEITSNSKVGIWGNQVFTARIYDDKITVTTPYVKWVNNSVNLAFKKTVIRDQIAVNAVLAYMADDDEYSAANRIRYIITYQCAY